MGTPNSIKTDNSPAYISRQFKRFLHSFSIKQITGISYNPQTQDIFKQTHHTLKLQIKKFKKGEYTGTLQYSCLESPSDLKNILHWNLVKSALDKEDKSVPVYSPLFNFLFVVSVCNVFG